MPYKSKVVYNKYQKEYMRHKRQVVRPSGKPSVRPSRVTPYQVDADGYPIPTYS